MSEVPSFNAPETEEQLQHNLARKCSDLLNLSIPAKLALSNDADKRIMGRRIAAQFLAYDYRVDGLLSYRVRLEPDYLLEGEAPTFKQVGNVREMFVIVPRAFVKDVDSLEGIELAIVSLIVDTPETTIEQRYIISPTAVKPFSKFDDLRLDFQVDEKTGESWVADISIAGGNGSQDTRPTTSSTKDQLESAQAILKLIDQFDIGNQSRGSS